jgi:two-component system NtrC family response regulator
MDTQERSEQRSRILIVDDLDEIRTQLQWGLKPHFDVVLAATSDEARRAILNGSYDAVTLDLGLPPDADGAAEGLRLLEELLRHDPGLKIVVLTGNTDHENAVRAVRLGAYDYVAKPVDLEKIAAILQRATALSRLDREALRPTAVEAGAAPLPEIIGDSPAMRQVFDTIRRVARTDVTVLISGESGTGKELIARALHAQSPRRERPFAAINCGAIPETLVESELFGLEMGSFTGAHAQRKGRLEMADGGTVFLDEIAELPPAIQVKLLRVLQERQFERVGGRALLQLDVRILAATNRNAEQAMRDGKFREDLYYRLAAVSIHIPPLRERLDDLRALASHFLERFAAEYRVRVRHFSAEALAALDTYAWPGNVRELENRIKRAVLMAQRPRITAADLGLAEGYAVSAVGSLKDARDAVERNLLISALRRYRGNVSRAAAAVQISRTAFHQLLTKHGIDTEEYR